MKRKHKLLIVGCAVLVLAGIGVKLYLDHYIWAGRGFVSRASEQLDLRGASLTVEKYDELSAEMPDCEITWNVPFQDGYASSDIREMQVSSLTQEDVGMLKYFPYLTRLDAMACSDYDELLLVQNSYPNCSLAYQVTIGDATYSNDVTALNIENPSMEELEEKLQYLTNVEAVCLTGQLPDIGELEHLQASYPQIDLRWEVTIGDLTLESTAAELDLSGIQIGYDEAQRLLSLLPRLEKADMRGCGLTDEEMMSLAQSFGNCFFLWEMTIGEVVVSTDAEEIDISEQLQESTELIESRLPYFPNLKKVVMSKCGLDDETMDALNKKYEDIRFVWSVYIKNVYVRTDATYFYPYKFNRDMYVTNEEIYPLRYCTDMVCIDIGHMGDVTDCEWAAFMPELKYLIIGETRISDLSPLANCKKLVYLELFTIPATDYSPLVECTALEDLNLGKTYGDPAPIAKMTWLKNIWWSGVDGTTGRVCSNAKAVLTEALPNTHLRFNLAHPTADGWRRLDNYYAMRDYMDMFYLT